MFGSLWSDVHLLLANFVFEVFHDFSCNLNMVLRLVVDVYCKMSIYRQKSELIRESDTPGILSDICFQRKQLL